MDVYTQTHTNINKYDSRINIRRLENCGEGADDGKLESQHANAPLAAGGRVEEGGLHKQVQIRKCVSVHVLCGSLRSPFPSGWGSPVGPSFLR